MATQYIALQNFTGGEISAWQLSARYDIAKYKTACKKLRNFICELHGDLRRRPGTIFCEDLGGPACLVPFQFNTDPNQNYALVFQNLKIRIAQGSGFVLSGGVPVQVTTPYLAADLFGISYAQSGDVIYLAHKNYALRKLVRTSHTSWALTTVVFTPSIPSVSGVGVSYSGSGSYTLRYVVCAENEDGEISLMGTPGADAAAKYPSDWTAGDYVDVTWTPVTGAVRYLLYREEGGYYGLVGVAEGQAAATFRDIKYDADTTDTPPEATDYFGDGNNPSLVGFHEQRLMLASGAKQPQAFYGSKTGSFEDWSKSRPLKDDDPVKFIISSGSIDAVQWMASFGSLLLGTGGVEYKAQSGDAAITPTNIQIKAQSYWGSTNLRPLIIGNSVLHVQRQGSRVRDLFFSLEKDGYAGNDLSVLAPHLFDGYSITQWAYQQAPGSVIWAVRDDGTLLGLTYMKEHEIWGWHPHETQGDFTSVCSTSGSLEDTVWFVVKRTINGTTKYYLEKLATKWRAEDGIEEAVFLDCVGTYRGEPSSYITDLSFLEGCEVNALVDGAPVRGLTVTGGGLHLPNEGSVVHVGLPYTSLMIPMTPEADTQQGTTLGAKKAYGRCALRLIDTVGAQYGPDENTLYDLPFTPANWGEAVQPESGDRDFSPAGGFDALESICIAQELPLPLTVGALALEVTIER
jgi:hypothetical protein